MASEVGAYMDDYANMTIWHIRDQCSSKRRIILAKDIQHLFVPHYEDLSKEKILEFAALFPKAMECLPLVEHERLKLRRQYIVNIVFTMVGEPFKNFVEQVIQARNQKI